METTYPVTIGAEDYEVRSGRPLDALVNTPNRAELDDLIERAHECVYNLIYRTGGKRFKDRLIERNLADLRGPLRRALFCQLDYMMDAGGDWGTTDGSSVDERGALIITDPVLLRGKQIAPKVLDILVSTRPALLAGMET